MGLSAGAHLKQLDQAWIASEIDHQLKRRKASSEWRNSCAHGARGIIREKIVELQAVCTSRKEQLLCNKLQLAVATESWASSRNMCVDLLSAEVAAVVKIVVIVAPASPSSASHVSSGLATAEHALSVVQHVEALLPALAKLSHDQMHSHTHTAEEEEDAVLDTAADMACTSIRKTVVVLRLKEMQENEGGKRILDLSTYDAEESSYVQESVIHAQASVIHKHQELRTGNQESLTASAKDVSVSMSEDSARGGGGVGGGAAAIAQIFLVVTRFCSGIAVKFIRNHE